MKRFASILVLAALLCGAVAAPAEAQHYYGHGFYHNGNGNAVVFVTSPYGYTQGQALLIGGPAPSGYVPQNLTFLAQSPNYQAATSPFQIRLDPVPPQQASVTLAPTQSVTVSEQVNAYAGGFSSPGAVVLPQTSYNTAGVGAVEFIEFVNGHYYHHHANGTTTPATSSAAQTAAATGTPVVPTAAAQLAADRAKVKADAQQLRGDVKALRQAKQGQ